MFFDEVLKPVFRENNLSYFGKYPYVKSDNEKIDILRKSASKYFDNSLKVRKFINGLESIILNKGYQILIDDGIVNEYGVSVNGQVKKLESGCFEIKLNPNANNLLEFVIIHEITHVIETKEMEELVVDYLSGDYKYSSLVYKLKKYKDSEVFSEILADICGYLFGNIEFIESLSVNNMNVFVSVYDKIVELSNDIVDSNLENFVKDLKCKWEYAYRSGIGKNLSKPKFSIRVDKSGNKYVNVDTDQDMFEGKLLSEQTKIAKKYIIDNFRESGLIKNMENVIVTSRTANEYTHPRNKNSKDVVSSKMRASTELDNLLEVSIYSHSNHDDGRHFIAKDGWDYYKVNFRVRNQNFEGLINIAKNGNKKTLYDITRIKKTSRVGSDKKSTTTNVTSFNDNTISFSDEKVNTSNNNSIQ